MGKILLILQREYLVRVKKKSFLLMTFLGPILMAGLFVGAIYFSLQETTDHKVLVVDESPGYFFKDGFENKDHLEYFYSDKDISDKEFEDSPYSLMLYLPTDVVERSTGVLYYKKMPSISTMSGIENSLEKLLEDIKLKQNNIDKAVYDQVNTNFNLVSRNIEDNQNDTYTKELSVVGFGFAIVIYFFIFLYGVQVMRGVIEEKTNRIVEVLISSVKPFQLMMGKILGIAAVALTQFLLWVGLTFGLSTVAQMTLLKDKFAPEAIAQNQVTTDVIQQNMDTLQAVPSETEYIFDLISRINFPLLLGVFVFYFLFGYLLYAALFAAIGSAVDNETDSQQFMLPVTIPLVIGFIVAETSILNPEGAAATWFSIIPFTSPIVMMVRIAPGLSAGSSWQLFVSMFLLIGTFLALTWLAAKIYRTGILMYGKKPTFKEMIKWIKYSN